jgi:hypothetical protein
MQVNKHLMDTWARYVQIPQAPDPLLTSQWKNLNTNGVSVTNATRVTVKPTVGNNNL